jgi:XTP/dITP diphosphohydrolase
VSGRLLLATHNAGKLAEVAALLAPLGIETIGAGALGLPVPAETGDSFVANATLKASAAARASGLVALADDSGFSLAALDGAPGIHSADWAERPDGTRDYGAAMAQVEQRARGAADRRAWFTCALVLAWPDGRTAAFVGECHGAWTWPPRGGQGFGYDPMFVPAGHARTFGEMAAAEKQALSHRAAAFAKLLGGGVLTARPG